MTQDLDFLRPDTTQIRHQIRGILDSYSHDWDVLAELAQNAVDAIRIARPARGHVYIEVDAPKKRIVFTDNGVGIPPESLPTLLRPFGTNKASDPTQVGEKGVGLTFVIFSTSEFEVTTHHENGHSCARISGASAWLTSQSSEPLLLEPRPAKADEHGTRFELTLSANEHPIFDYTFAQLCFGLRTKTALGDTGYICDYPLNADFHIRHIDKGGVVSEKEFDCKYFLPIEASGKPDMLSYDDYQSWMQDGDRSDAEKRKKLQNKIVYRVGKKFQGGRELRFWSCFVPNRAVWEKLSQIARVADEIDGDEKGSAGYVPNFSCSSRTRRCNSILAENPSMGGSKGCCGKSPTPAFGNISTRFGSTSVGLSTRIPRSGSAMRYSGRSPSFRI
jgi:hypothetical protein